MTHGMELGSVTLKRIGFFCFPIKHSTHTKDDNALEQEKEGASGESSMQGRVSGARRAGGPAAMCRRP